MPEKGDRLARARLYLCTDARERQGDLPDFLDAVLGAGVDIVQLRQKGLEAAQELALLEVFREKAARHGALFAVNDRADLAYAARADVLHLGQDDLPVGVARAIIGPGPVIGRSSHAEPETSAEATAPGVDYFCTGPVWPTPTKPGRPARPACRSSGTPRPWAPPAPGSRSAGSPWTTWARCWKRARGVSWWSGRSPRPPARPPPRPNSRAACAPPRSPPPPPGPPRSLPPPPNLPAAA